SAGFGSVWVPDFQGDTVARIEPETSRVVANVKVGHRPLEVAFDRRFAWVSNFDDATVSRIDPATDRVTGTVEVPAGQPQGLIVAFGSLWVTSIEGAALYRVDPESLKVVGQVVLHSGPR